MALTAADKTLATALSTSTSPFRLLDLPRELRDIIYEYAISDRDLRHKYGGTFRVTIKNCPYLQLLLSCRQVFCEYRLATRKKVILVLSDRFLSDVGIKPARLPNSLKRIQTLHVFLFDVVPPEETELHTKWLEKLATEMRGLKAVRIRVDVTFAEGDDRPWPNSQQQDELRPKLDRLVVLRRLERVEVHRLRGEMKKDNRADALAETNANLYAVWESTKGWEGEVETAESG